MVLKKKIGKDNKKLFKQDAKLRQVFQKKNIKNRFTSVPNSKSLI